MLQKFAAIPNMLVDVTKFDDIRMDGQQETKKNYTIRTLNILDFIPLIQIVLDEFRPKPEAKISFLLDAISLLLPKLILPQFVMGHKVIGLIYNDEDKNEKRISGIADISLQITDGSMSALDRTTVLHRTKVFGNELKPYLCNFLIVEGFRRQGLGGVLLEACEREAINLGHNELCLHVESSNTAGLAFYASNRYAIIKKIDPSIYFMKKNLRV